MQKSPPTLDDIMETLIENLAWDRGGHIKTYAKLTGDNGDGVADAGDLANPNIFKVNNNGLAVIGGRDSGGNYRVDFGGDKAEAQEFVTEVQDVFADFRSILTRDTKLDHRGEPVDDSRPDTDIVQQLIFRAAEAFGGKQVRAGGLNGDSFDDNVAFTTGRGAVRPIQDGDIIQIQGTGTSGQLRYQFDDAETAERFEKVVEDLILWGAEYF